MIYSFTTNSRVGVSQVGGKSKALIEMTKAGLRVPEGIALSVDFFKPWDDAIRSTGLWKKVLKHTTKEACDELKVMATGQVFTKEQRELLEKSFGSIKKHGVYAVRSSSPEEDMEGTSFAGMYETLLGVKEDQIEKAVAQAYSSMYDYRVMAYKEQNKLNLENTRISIIVQRQIPSTVSGIGFSINPNNNSYDETMINASFGLGEAIVSGIVSPDTYVVDKNKNIIDSRTINEKKIALWLKVDGGIEEKKNKEPKKQALSDSKVIEVSKMIKRTEDYYGIPMDTEWAYDGSVLYLLQARPITTYIPLIEDIKTKPGEQKHIYVDLIALTQGFSEHFSVLGLELFNLMVLKAKQDMFPLGKGGIVIGTDGKQYMDLSNMAKAFGLKRVKSMLPQMGGNLSEVLGDTDWEEYMPKEKSPKLKGLTMKVSKASMKMMPSILRGLFKDPNKVVETYEENVGPYKEKIRKGYDPNVPFTKSVDSFFEILGIIMADMGIMMAGIMAEKKLKAMFNNTALENEVMTLGMDLPTNPTSAMGHALFALASHNEIVHTQSAEEFEDKVLRRKYSKEFMALYDDYMYQFGCRGFKEIDIASPRAYEDLEEFYIKLKHINIEDSQIQTVKERKAVAYDKLLKEAEKMGKARSFKKYAEVYAKTFGYREDPKFVYVIFIDQLRKVALHLGREFVKQGRLNNVNEIFSLSIDEISRAQKDSRIDLQSLIHKNTEFIKATKSIKNWPVAIDSRGKIFRKPIEIKDGDMVGQAISPGVIRGKAKVLYTPYEKELLPGEILVTKATEPSWTPIFINAAGVVLEVGGPLQHGAIIAREYGIPCVSGLDNIQEIIKDGDIIEVDGSNGTVRILQE